jgi:hypothetical protein
MGCSFRFAGNSAVPKKNVGLKVSPVNRAARGESQRKTRRVEAEGEGK